MFTEAGCYKEKICTECYRLMCSNCSTLLCQRCAENTDAVDSIGGVHRYLVFGYDDHQKLGGMDDLLREYCTLDEAKRFVEDHKTSRTGCDTYKIYDVMKRRVNRGRVWNPVVHVKNRDRGMEFGLYAVLQKRKGKII